MQPKISQVMGSNQRWAWKKPVNHKSNDPGHIMGVNQRRLMPPTANFAIKAVTAEDANSQDYAVVKSEAKAG